MLQAKSQKYISMHEHSKIGKRQCMYFGPLMLYDETKWETLFWYSSESMCMYTALRKFVPLVCWIN